MEMSRSARMGIRYPAIMTSRVMKVRLVYKQLWRRARSRGDEPMAITPYLLYQDAAAAVDWLAKAFGLRPDEVLKGPDGRVGHASMTFGKSLLMFGSPGPDFKGPRAIGHWTANLYVDVDDVETH